MTHKTLGELILTDYAAARPILEAWARGEPLGMLDNTAIWIPGCRIVWLQPGCTYRIPSRPHTVDWSHVGERIVAFETLSHSAHVAVFDNGNRVPTHYWPSFRPGTMPWPESRIERPKEVK